MSLVMIEGTVPRTLWWAGNSPAGLSDQTYVIGIHHPAGTRKRITFHAHFTSANGDLDMDLHDGCGGILTFPHGTTDDENISWHNTLSSPKEVYLNVYLFNDTRNAYYLDFNRYAPTPPANNACSSAYALDLGSPGTPRDGRVYATTTGATVDGSTNCVTTGPDVWH